MIKIASSESAKGAKTTKNFRKKWWMWAILGIVLVIIVLSIGGGKEQSSVTSPQKFSFEQYIQSNKVREYKLLETEDISIPAKFSDYSPQEWKNLPENVRVKYSILVPQDITVEELKSTLAKVIKDESEKNPDIDEIVVYAWDSEESFEGALPVGRALWCPQGKWGEVSPEIAQNNIRDSYKIIYDINEKFLKVNQVEGEIKFELKESERKAIAYELDKCEIDKDFQAMKYYYPGCEACPEFITSDMNKYLDKRAELIEACKENVRKKYHITEDVEVKIVVEAVEKNWPGPKIEKLKPDCCK